MKKILSALLTLILLLTCLAPMAFAAKDVTVRVDGVEVVFPDAQPFVNRDGRTMVPLRAVADAMDLEVAWDGEARVASFTERGVAYGGQCPWTNTIRFPIGSRTAHWEAAANWVASEPDIEYGTVSMNTAAIIQNNRTYAPVRYLAEYFGWVVGWNGDSRTVSILNTDGYVSPAQAPGDNLLVGTWELNSNNWTQESLRKIGIVQDTVHLIFQPGGKMAYQIWDTLYEGTYLLTTDGGIDYAIAQLENGWILGLDLLNMALTVDGLPMVTVAYSTGTHSTDTWGFYKLNNNTSIGLDPWMR